MSETEMMISCARNVIASLIGHGYDAYFVGGYVRDSILQRSITDVDIATSALPEEVMKIFPRTVPTGIKHGTVTVLVDNHTFEVTTFRQDAEYEQFRRPKEVTFIAELTEDLRRRDFTMNAMALSLDGQLIDPFGGMEHMAQHILSCVGDPRERFKEDALRMIRCVRFAAEYELEIEANTWQAILLQNNLLQHIAMERIRSELERMIEGTFPAQGLRLLLDSQLLDHLKVDLQLPISTLANCGIDRLSPLSNITNKSSRWTFLFLMIGESAEQAKAVMRKLTFSRKRIDAIGGLLHFHEKIIEALQHLHHRTEAPQHDKKVFNWNSNTDAIERLWKQETIESGKILATQWLGLAATTDLLSLCTIVGKHLLAEHTLQELSQAVQLIVQHGNDWLLDIAIEHQDELVISGSDLLTIGQAAGPWIGKVLRQLVVDVALHRLPNERDSLLNSAVLYVKEMNDHE